MRHHEAAIRLFRGRRLMIKFPRKLRKQNLYSLLAESWDRLTSARLFEAEALKSKLYFWVKISFSLASGWSLPKKGNLYRSFLFFWPMPTLSRLPRSWLYRWDKSERHGAWKWSTRGYNPQLHCNTMAIQHDTTPNWPNCQLASQKMFVLKNHEKSLTHGSLYVPRRRHGHKVEQPRAWSHQSLPDNKGMSSAKQVTSLIPRLTSGTNGSLETRQLSSYLGQQGMLNVKRRLYSWKRTTWESRGWKPALMYIFTCNLL